LKWKIIEEVFERRKNDSRFIEENGRILALGIFRLVLFPNLIGTNSLEAAATFIENENTQINPTIAILAKTILTLNHCKRVFSGTMRCEQMLYIWLISHIETKNPVFNNFWWFSNKPLKILKKEEWKDPSKEN
jgi:hypothetical protein